MPAKKKGSFIVRLRCTVIKEIVCENCFEHQAKSNPWDFAEGDETEIEQTDWEVIRVDHND